MIQKVDKLFSHRVLILFDHCIGRIDPDNQDEILLYHLIACMYICFKVDIGFSGIPFSQFLHLCSLLPSYISLSKHLAPHLEVCVWTPELYNLLENEILYNTLHFKTRFVSSEEILNAFFTQIAQSPGVLNDSNIWPNFVNLVKEASFRSKICQLCK